jgi:hypothetical protein
VGVGSQGVLMSPQLNGDLTDLVSDLWNAPKTPLDRFVASFASTVSASN